MIRCQRARSQCATLDWKAARAGRSPPGRERAREIRRTLEEIHAKEFITVNEAACLLSCSASHSRNLVKKAGQKKNSRPIPFRDLDGVVTFNREELLQWSQPRALKLAPTGTE